MFRIGAVALLGGAVLTGLSQAQVASTAGIYAVGSCKPNLPSYPTISAALAAAPAPTQVQICPGSYPEQIVITQPVTLQGITSGGVANVVVTPPSGGNLVALATDQIGRLVAPQLWVNNVTAGNVNVSDITFDGTGGTSVNGLVTGIFYQNSAGTISHVATRFQGSYGVWLEGGSSSPHVTVSNNSIHDFGTDGIFVEDFAGSTPDLTAGITNNYVNANGCCLLQYGIVILGQSNFTASGNTVLGGTFSGITAAGGALGTVSGNTVYNSEKGIVIGLNEDSATVSGNKIINASVAGIGLESAGTVVKSNNIMGGASGIDFGCLANPNVSANVINEVSTGLSSVPSAVASQNNYFSVGTIRSGC